MLTPSSNLHEEMANKSEPATPRSFKLATRANQVSGQNFEVGAAPLESANLDLVSLSLSCSQVKILFSWVLLWAQSAWEENDRSWWAIKKEREFGINLANSAWIWEIWRSKQVSFRRGTKIIIDILQKFDICRQNFEISRKKLNFVGKNLKWVGKNLKWVGKILNFVGKNLKFVGKS